MADFAALQVILNSTGLAKDNPKLYQFLNNLLTASTNLNQQTTVFIGGGSSGGGGGGGTGITGSGTAGRLAAFTSPSSIGNNTLPSATGTFGNVSNVPQITVDSNGIVSNIVNIPISSVDYVVLSDGNTPPSPVNDGGGNFIYVGYTP